MNNTITIHYALFISEGTRYFTSTESLSSIQNKIDETTRNCISSFESFGQKTKYEPGAFLYGAFTDTQSQNDYFAFTFVVSRLDELAKRETNFRYQALLPLKDFKALCAAGYDINTIIKTLFTKKLLTLKNKSHDYKPELAKQLSPEEIKHMALFDYQLGLKQVQAQFQDQSLFEDSLTALIYDNRFQLHFGKVDSFSTDWDKDSADLTKRKDSQGEAFVSALWQLLPVQTRLQRGVSTGLPDKDDAMYKACHAQTVAAIALQFQNSTALKATSEQALKRIDTHAQDFQSIKRHYVKPLLAAIEADDRASILALQKNYTIENTTQPNQGQATVSKTSSKSPLHSTPSKENRTVFKWLPIGLIAFLSLTILFLLANEEPITTDNETQRLEWEQSHKELKTIKETVWAEQTQGWSVDAFLQDWEAKKQSEQALARMKEAVSAEQLSNDVFIENIADWKARAENQADSTQQSKWQQAHQNLANIKQAFDAEQWTSKKLISHLKSLKLDSDTTNQQLDLLEALLLEDWDGAKNKIKTLGSKVIATQATDLVGKIQTWQENSAAHEKAQETDTAQYENQKTLKTEHEAMQSLLEKLIAKNWEDAKKHSSSLVNLPTVNNDNLIKFIGNMQIISVQDDKLQQEVVLLRTINTKLETTNSTLQKTQGELNNAIITKNEELEEANKIIKGYRQQVVKLESDLSTAKSTTTSKNNELDQVTTKLNAIEQNNKKAQELLTDAKASIKAKKLNTAKSGKPAKEIYFEILALYPDNPYVEATVGLFYGIPEKYKRLSDKRRFKWLKTYKTDFLQDSTLQPYLEKFNAGGSRADLESYNVSSQLTKAETFLKESLNKNFLKNRMNKINDAINAYRKLLSVEPESAKFGLTVLVPLYYYLQDKKIESALSYLEHLENDARANYYDFFKNSISKLSNINELLADAEKKNKAIWDKRLVDAENKNQAILTSLDWYFKQYSTLLETTNSGSQYETEPDTIESKVQEVFDIVDEYIRIVEEDLESTKSKLSAYEQKMLSLSSILYSNDCKRYHYRGMNSSYYWLYSTCADKLNEQLQQQY